MPAGRGREKFGKGREGSGAGWSSHPWSCRDRPRNLHKTRNLHKYRNLSSLCWLPGKLLVWVWSGQYPGQALVLSLD